MAASKKTQPQAIVLTEPSARATRQTWTPGLIRSAEAQADGGNLWLAGELVEFLLTDERVARCVQALAGVSSLPLVFPPPDGSDPEKNPISQALGTDWWRFLSEAEQYKLIAYGRILGVAPIHVSEWVRDDVSGRLLPICEVWNPKHLRYSWDTRQWSIETTDGFVVIDHAEDSDWWLYRPFGRVRPWALAPWRGISRWWLLKQYAQSDWGRYSQRQGEGRQVITQEADEYTVNIDDATRRAIANDLRSMGGNAAIALPPGFDYQLVESTAKTYQTFVDQTNMANAAISIGLCGQNLTSEISGGSFAAAQVHDAVEMRFIRAIATTLSTDVRDGLLVWYVEFNFGDRKQTPYPEWTTTPPNDSKSRSETLLRLADAIGRFVAAGITPDLVALGKEFDFELSAAAPAKAPSKTATQRAAQALAGSRLTDGQRYIEQVEEKLVAHGARELGPTLAAVLSAIEDSESYEDALAKLFDAYRGAATPNKLTELLDAGMTMANFAGALQAKREAS